MKKESLVKQLRKAEDQLEIQMNEFGKIASNYHLNMSDENQKVYNDHHKKITETEILITDLARRINGHKD